MSLFRTRANACIGFAVCACLVLLAVGRQKESAEAYPLPAAAADWPVYHRDNLRSGYVADMPNPQSLMVAWNTQLDGAVYAEPLGVAGHIIAATENNTIYSLDTQTGRIEWKTHIAAPMPLSKLPCGNINPLGITGTPAYDSATGLVFAVAETTGPAHLLVGVDLRSGEIRMRRSAEPPHGNPAAHQQRAALAVSRGMVYVAYGGLYGDCGEEPSSERVRMEADRCYRFKSQPAGRAESGRPRVH